MGLGIGRLLAAPSWTDLRSRLISAVVLGLVFLAAALAGGVVFRLLCVATGFIIFDEWARITRAKRVGPIFVFARRALAVALAAFLFEFYTGAVLVIVFATLFILFVDRRERSADWVAGGLVYASMASLAPGMLRGDDAEGLAALGLVVIVVVATDIFAYFTGRAIGGPKLMPLVSPKKTISGAVGGLLAGILFGLGYSALVSGRVDLILPLLAGLLSVLGQAGDLFESWVKRRFGVKDSGRLIPGHGGLMDRIDALIIATAALWLTTVAIRGLDEPARAVFSL